MTDLQVPPVGGPFTVGDRRRNVPIVVFCGDEPMMHLVVVDDRVLVMPTRGAEHNMVFEKPLSPAQVERFQYQLEDMKFSDSAPTGQMDAATRRAAGFYASYRGAARAFEVPGITENLLDGLRVLEEE